MKKGEKTSCYFNHEDLLLIELIGEKMPVQRNTMIRAGLKSLAISLGIKIPKPVKKVTVDD